MRHSSVTSDVVVFLLTVLFSTEFCTGDACAFDGVTPLPDGLPGEVLTLDEHTSVTQFVSFLPDGRHLVTSGRPGLLVWDLKEAQTLRKSALIGVSAVSPDGKVVAVVSRGEIKLVETGTAKTIAEVAIKPTGTVRVLSFSPDGKRLASAGDGNVVQLWDAKTGDHERDLKGHTKTVRAMTFGPDNSTIVSAGYDRTVHVWNASTGRAHRPPFKVPFELWSAQISPDGRYLLGAGRSSDIYLWNLATGQEVRKLAGHIAFVHRAVFSPDGRRVVSGADDKTVRCWDLQTGRELARFHGHSCNVLDVAISPDGRFAASVAGGATIDGKWTPGDDFKVRVWRLPHVSKLPWNGLNLTGIVGGGPGPFPKLKGISSQVLALDLSADGRIFATGEKDGSIRLWGMETGKEMAKVGSSTSMVRSVSLSSAGKQLVTAADDGLLRLWDVNSGEELLSCPASQVGGRIFSVDFLADNRRVVAGLHGSVRIWDTSDNSVTELGAKNIHIHEVTTSDDGATIAAACNDAVVRVWDAFSGELLHKLEGHTEEVQGVAFSPDGITLASCSRDATVRIWNVGSGELLQTITGHSKWIYSVEFLADGRRVMTGSGPQEGWIRTWDIQTGKQVWMFGTDWRHTRHIATTPDARYAVTANSDTVTILRLPVLKNMTAYEEYELARRNEGPDKRIAVLDFVDKGPSVKLAPLRTALSELLTARLHQYRRVSTVERLQVQQFLEETKLGASGLVDSKTAQHAGKALTADYLLSGSFSGDGDTITVNASLIKSNAEQPLTQWTVTGKSGELFDIEKRLVAKTLNEIGIAAPSIEAMAPAKSGVSPTVAVMSFQNLGSVATKNVPATEEGVSDSELQALQAGLGELLQVGLTTVPNLRVVEREALEKVLQEQKLTLNGAIDPMTAARIGKLAGASRFIYGSFLKSGGKITVVARLADTETAAVLSTEIAEGPTDDLSTMIETLATRLATRLNITPPQDTARLVRLALPVRKLEAMVHHSRGVELARSGNLEAAFASFDRALLIEPKNLNIYMLCVQLADEGVRKDLLIRACENALAQSFPPHRRHERQYVYNYYINGLAASGLTAKRAEIVRRRAREFPQNATNQRSARSEKARILRKTDRAKAIAIHEEALRQAETSGNVSNIASELSSLYWFYSSETNHGDKNSPEITRDSAEESLKVVERLMTLLKGRRDSATRLTAQFVARSAAKAVYRKNAGDRSLTYLLSPEQRIDLNERLKATFGWDVGSRKLLTIELARLYKSTSQFDLAIASYRDYLASSVYVPKIVDGYAGSSFSVDPWPFKQAEIQYEIARILHKELKHSDKAIAEYQRYVRKFGVATVDGPKVWNALKDLGARPDFPKRSALICGGTTAALRSWQKVLAPNGFTVHLACEKHPVFADLAPYELVILTKWGDLPLDPVEVFAIRSYVATGGSLLAVVTPFWEAAAPGIHGPLLSLFDVQVSSKGIDPARSTRIRSDHPITQGIPAATARHAVRLDCPAEVSLIESNDQTVLAAIPYRAGRVVVSSFGQWLVPDPTIFGRQWQRHLAGVYGKNRPINTLPVAALTGTNATLIKQTIRWLTDKRPELDAIAGQREQFRQAWDKHLKFEAGAMSYADWTAGVSELIDKSEGMWKEEALWLAGETHLRQHFRHVNNMRDWPTPRESNDGLQLAPEFDFFNRLVEQFSDSRLRQFAEWRQVECLHRNSLRLSRGSSYISDSTPPEIRRKLISWYEKVRAPEGSVPWAWAQMRIGWTFYIGKDYEKAAEHYRSVSELMPNGPDKVRALLDLSVTLQKNGQREEAIKAAATVLALPNVEWNDRMFEHFSPLSRSLAHSHVLAEGIQ